MRCASWSIQASAPSWDARVSKESRINSWADIDLLIISKGLFATSFVWNAGLRIELFWWWCICLLFVRSRSFATYFFPIFFWSNLGRLKRNEPPDSVVSQVLLRVKFFLLSQPREVLSPSTHDEDATKKNDIKLLYRGYAESHHNKMRCLSNSWMLLPRPCFLRRCMKIQPHASLSLEFFIYACTIESVQNCTRCHFVNEVWFCTKPDSGSLRNFVSVRRCQRCLS